jgi:uncharacterized membrane protein (UPF0127 family)
LVDIRSPVGQKLSQYRNRFLELLEEPMRMSDPGRPDVWVEVDEARGFFGRAKGLLGSSEVGAGRGLLIRGKQVHTLGMRYPIDTVYLDSQGRVLRIDTLKPGRVGPLIFPARWVLELDAGEAGRLGITTGITLLPGG